MKEVISVKLCFPVIEDKGLDSQINAHFGSAPAFLVVETEDQSYEILKKSEEAHAHGSCNPLANFAGKKIDGLVVGGIGRGAWVQLNAAGIKVFVNQGGIVKDAVAAYTNGKLPLLAENSLCGGHDGGHGGGCS
jgi:predicted Fe-Mo cluster-binding NifX family protein